MEIYWCLKQRFNISIFDTGRAALQKRIMALLRKIEHCVNGVQPVSAYLNFFKGINHKTLNCISVNWRPTCQSACLL
jgi:hypothetical protein